MHPLTCPTKKLPGQGQMGLVRYLSRVRSLKGHQIVCNCISLLGLTNAKYPNWVLKTTEMYSRTVLEPRSQVLALPCPGFWGLPVTIGSSLCCFLHMTFPCVSALCLCISRFPSPRCTTVGGFRANPNLV